jgi:hypothetical protein
MATTAGRLAQNEPSSAIQRGSTKPVNRRVALTLRQPAHSDFHLEGPPPPTMIPDGAGHLIPAPGQMDLMDVIPH